MNSVDGSAMRRHHRIGLSAVVVVLVIAGAACDALKRPRLPTEADAIARGREAAHLDEPVCVLRVREGRAGDLYDGPSPSEPMGMEGTFKAKMERPAWRIELASALPDSECNASGVATEFLILDRDTGDVLVSGTPAR